MSTKIVNNSSSDDLFERVSECLLALLKTSTNKAPHFNIALSGGATAKEFFGFLLSQLAGHKSLSLMRFFFSDERVVKCESEDSNAGNASRLLLNPLGIDSSQIFPMYDDKYEPKICAQNYEKKLRQLLPSNKEGIPVFDLIFLGIGDDGHTASIFPHSKLLHNNEDLVAVAYEKNISYTRLTMMPRLINAAHNIYVLAYGPRKTAVLDQIIYGKMQPDNLPAQLVLRNQENNVVLFTS